MTTLRIFCPCGNLCGREYQSTGQTWGSGGEMGYREGIGENFSLNDKWYCSQTCMDEAQSEAKNISESGQL
jgi:hypothetical protein